MLGTESAMALNFADHGNFGIGLGELNESANEHNNANLTVGTARSSLGNGPAENGSVGGVDVSAAEAPVAAGVAGNIPLLNGANGNGIGVAATAMGVQQPLAPATPPPSSWASKVRAGLGTDNSPMLTPGSRVAGGLGDISAVDLDADGLQGLPRAMGHLGPLTPAGGMGPVHGLDMEGGMPGRAGPVQVAAGSKGAVGAVGMGLGLQGTLQHRGGQVLGSAVPRRGSSSGPSSLANEGSGALAQEFAALGIGGGGLGSSGSPARGAEAQSFDATKDELLGDFPCVRLRGLAADTSVKDILDFFVGLGPVLDIVLESGASKGEIGAITLFGNLMDYHGALQRYSLQIKGRYIEVATAVRSDYYSAVIKRAGSSGSEGATTSYAGAEGNGNLHGNERGQLGSESAMGAAGAPLAHSPGPGTASISPSAAAGQGMSPGAASATPASGQAVTAAASGAGAPAGTLLAPGGQPSPSVSVPSPGVGAGHAGGAGGRKGGMKAGPAGGGSSKAKGLTGDGKGAVIRMRGLPYRASKAEVMGFFKGCSIPEEGIAFVTRADGRVTGEAYVRFATREDAKMGIRRDREMMGSRYIELFTSSPEEMARYASGKR